MTATQARIDAIERIRREHIPDPDGDPAAPHCVTCSDASYPIWPCAAAWLLEQHDALTARIDRSERALLDILREAAWEARLTEWRKHAVTAVGTQPTPHEACREIRDIARRVLHDIGAETEQ